MRRVSEDRKTGLVTLSIQWKDSVVAANWANAVVMRLNEAINKALASPAFIDRFGKIGDEPAGGLPEDFAETIRVELAKWADVIKRSGAKLE